MNGVLSLRATDKDQNHAYAAIANAIIVMFYHRNPKKKHDPGDGKSHPVIVLHETGHLLDYKAYGNSSRLSSTREYQKEYAKDTKVADDYAASNFGENIAQNTVLATYDLVVPGGFQSVTKDWQSVQHQVGIMKRKQEAAGHILIPQGKCGQRRRNSLPVRIQHPHGKNITRRESPVLSTVHLDGGLEPRYSPSGPSRRAYMAGTLPNVDFPEGLEVITPRSEVDTEHICEARDL